MILLSVLLVPLGIAVMFIVMARTERSLDGPRRRKPTPAPSPTVEIATVVEPVVA